MIKKIIIVAVIALAIYLVAVWVPQRWRQAQREEEQKTLLMEQQARERARTGAAGGDFYTAPINRARANEERALNRSTNNLQQTDDQQQ